MTLSVGFNWQESLLKRLGDLNERYAPEAIDEVYGSLPGDPIGSAREQSRLKRATVGKAERALQAASEVGIEVNYLLNSPTVPPLRGARRKEARAFLRKLVDAGVSSFTVTAPHLVQALRQWFGDIPIDVSSVASITSVQELQYYVSLGVRRAKLPIDCNRQFALLEGLASNCGATEIELIVNECCILHCPLRAHHLITQGMTYLGHSAPSDYPYNWCYEELFPGGRPSVEFLKSPWIRPADLAGYERIGIRRFKISGRTMPEPWIVDTAEAYVARREKVDLMKLFPIVAGRIDSEGNASLVAPVDASKLDGFIDFFERTRPDCRRECEITCHHCYSYYRTRSAPGKAGS